MHLYARRYAKLEEEHGLMRNAMAVYQRAVETVVIDKRHELYNMYIAKAAEYFGVTKTRYLMPSPNPQPAAPSPQPLTQLLTLTQVTKTRDIYESSINALPATLVPAMCIRYANPSTSSARLIA